MFLLMLFLLLLVAVEEAWRRGITARVVGPNACLAKINDTVDSGQLLAAKLKSTKRKCCRLPISTRMVTYGKFGVG